MAYDLRYKLKAIGKSGYLITCNIYEKDFVGSYENMEVCSKPFTINEIAQSDDVYLPILSSELIVRADITNFTGTLPDFTTNDDRKYWVELRATKDSDDFLLWQGFILTDNVQLNFSTGFQELVFSCTDGFAMLKNIPYDPAAVDGDINTMSSLTDAMLKCFNKLQLPYSFYLNVCVSIFASGMNDRGDGTQYEPFAQTYYPARNFLNSNDVSVIGVTSTSPYMSCYDVLEKIALSWGCQMKQSGGEYYISNRAEEAEETIYFTKYLDDGSVADSGLKGFRRNILAWTDIANYYFIDNQQRKILRKGFPDLQIKCQTSYAPQMVDNGNMERLSGGFPYNWNKSATGVTATSMGSYNALRIAPISPIAPDRKARISPDSIAPAYRGTEAGDTLTLSFLIDGQAVPSSTVPKCWLYVLLISPSDPYEWYLDKDGNWIHTSLASPNVTPIDVFGTTTGIYESISYTSSPLPVSGTISLTWECDDISTLTCTVANVLLTYQSPYNYRLARNTVTDLSYQKLVEVSMGGACDDFSYNQIGSLTHSDGTTVWTGWYRYGKTESYTMLLDLLYQQYYNIVTVASVNVEGNSRKLLPGSSIEPNQAMTQFTIADSTGTISLTGKKYLIGNSTFDYIDNTLNNATLLETSNTDLTITGYSDRTIPKQ